MIHRYDVRFWVMFSFAERVIIALAIVLFLVFSCGDSNAQIPPDASKYKRDLVRNARLEWGLDAPTSTFAAQIHQESGWRPDVKSHAGAQGIAQFMPATAAWLVGVASHLGPHDAFNPAWAIRAMVAYDVYLFARVDALTHCERIAKMLSAYNGGLGWVHRDEAVCKANTGCMPDLWFGETERFNAGRSAANFAENRGYPRRILFELEPRYRNAGWGIYSCVQ